MARANGSKLGRRVQVPIEIEDRIWKAWTMGKGASEIARELTADGG